MKLKIANELSTIMGSKYMLGSIDCQTFAMRLLYEIFREEKIKSKLRKLARRTFGLKEVDDKVFRTG
jgi:hypothetical protein